MTDFLWLGVGDKLLVQFHGCHYCLITLLLDLVLILILLVIQTLLIVWTIMLHCIQHGSFCLSQMFSFISFLRYGKLILDYYNMFGVVGVYTRAVLVCIYLWFSYCSCEAYSWSLIKVSKKSMSSCLFTPSCLSSAS